MGSEAQRTMLSKEAAKRASGHTLYTLEEQTTGPHFEVVRKPNAVIRKP